MTLRKAVVETCKNRMAAALSSTLLLFITSLVKGQVLLIPPPMQVVFAGDSGLFQCLTNTVPRTTESIEWFINGSSLVNLLLRNVTTDLYRGVSNEIQGGILVFATVPVEYNMTRVYCRANFTTGDPVASITTQLIIQGLLDAVDSMACVSEDFSHVLLNWTSPFALIGASEITYCVDVVDLTNRRALQSECMISMTQFTFTMLRDLVCSGLSFTVTPVNVVGNGTTSSVQQTVCSTNPLVPPELIDIMLQSVPLGFLFVMSVPVCNAELKFEDVNTGEIITLRECNVTIEGTSIIILPQQLRDNRDYNVSITASNIAGRATSRTSIRTHDMKNFTPITVEFTDTSSSDSGPATRNSQTTVIVAGMAGGLVTFALASFVQSVVIVILCCKRRKGPVQPKQPETQNLQLYEEVRDQTEVAAPTRVTVRDTKKLAVPVMPQYEDITLPAGVATKSGDPYQITQCSAYGVSK